MTDRPAVDDMAAQPEGEAGAGAPELVPAEQVTAALEAASEFKDKLLRTLAEMENLRKRTEREVAEARLYGNASFARDVLAVADNMQRALDAIDPALRAGDPKVTSLIEGVELTERELLKVLEKHGVTKFTPTRREVRSQRASGDVRGGEPRTAAGPRRAGHPVRLHARRPRAAPGAGGGGQGRAESPAILRQRQSSAIWRKVDFSAFRRRRAPRGSG